MSFYRTRNHPFRQEMGQYVFLPMVPMLHHYSLIPVSRDEIAVHGEAAVRVMDPPTFGGSEHIIANQAALMAFIAKISTSTRQLLFFKLEDVDGVCAALGVHDEEHLLVMNEGDMRFIDGDIYVFRTREGWELRTLHTDAVGRIEAKDESEDTVWTFGSYELASRSPSFVGRVIASMYFPTPFPKI